MRLLFLLAMLLALTAAAPVYPPVLPTTAITLPRDHGAHPDFRTEWWYLTGWLKTPDGKDRGFQITFFRTRPPVDQANPSAFAPKQIIFAHAALSDPANGRLLHDQRIARQGFGLAEASATDTALTLDSWTLVRAADGRFHAHIKAKDFSLALALTPTQAAILQGEAGYSRKGPRPADASHYFSVPHLRVTGTVTQAGTPAPVTGNAWLDREWSSTYLNPRAVGWDWLGLNMADGGALTLFQIRDARGAKVWAGGSFRDKTGRQTRLLPADVTFTPTRWWRSPTTGARYPVAPRIAVRLPDGTIGLPVTPLFDNQELDSRRGGGPVYWEGAVTVPGGRGYLELTGYHAPLKM
jgi:predicted secreted hydrolase